MARKSTDPNAELFEAFTRFMASQATPAGETVPEPRKQATGARKSTRSSGVKAATLNATRKPKGTTPTRKTPKGVITCGEAWNLLGADPMYKPSDPNAPARNGQLWALNAAGKLRVV
jgi:hypothetical protein